MTKILFVSAGIAYLLGAAYVVTHVKQQMEIPANLPVGVRCYEFHDVDAHLAMVPGTNESGHMFYVQDPSELHLNEIVCSRAAK